MRRKSGMEFGIKSLKDGWFDWYINDNEKTVEITASSVTEHDFVKQLLRSLTVLIKDRTESRFSIFVEPGYETINMKVDDNNNFILEMVFEDVLEIQDGDMSQGQNYERFVTDMYRMRTEFVPSIIKAFKYYERSILMLEYYEVHWTLSTQWGDVEEFSFPKEELQQLHLVASDVRIK